MGWNGRKQRQREREAQKLAPLAEQQVAGKAWDNLLRRRMQLSIELISRYISEAIRPEGGNDYEEGKAAAHTRYAFEERWGGHPGVKKKGGSPERDIF